MRTQIITLFEYLLVHRTSFCANASMWGRGSCACRTGMSTTVMLGLDRYFQGDCACGPAQARSSEGLCSKSPSGWESHRNRATLSTVSTMATITSKRVNGTISDGGPCSMYLHKAGFIACYVVNVGDGTTHRG